MLAAHHRAATVTRRCHDASQPGGGWVLLQGFAPLGNLTGGERYEHTVGGCGVRSPTVMRVKTEGKGDKDVVAQGTKYIIQEGGRQHRGK